MTGIKRDGSPPPPKAAALNGDAHDWLIGVMQGIGADDLEDARVALRAVMRALRRALPAASVGSLGGRLPPSIRAMLESGVPPTSRTPVARTAKDFLSLVDRELPRSAELHPESVTRAVLGTLRSRLEPHELGQILHLLPRSLQRLSATKPDGSQGCAKRTSETLSQTATLK